MVIEIYKLIALDLDDTILNDELTISIENKEIVMEVYTKCTNNKYHKNKENKNILKLKCLNSNGYIGLERRLILI